MKPAWELVADEVLATLQERVSARDREGLLELFEDPAVLIGAGGDAHGAEGRVRYLTEITEQSAEVMWSWTEKRVFYETDDAVGFAAFGEIILASAGDESRLPFRLSLFVSLADGAWRIREFHGSVPLSQSDG